VHKRKDGRAPHDNRLGWLACVENFGDDQLHSHRPSGSTMTHGRVSRTATLLENGEVLIAGGEDQIGNPVDSAKLYDPFTCKFYRNYAHNDVESRASHSDPSQVKGVGHVSGPFNL
jgi:hypothetical protein